MNDKDLIIGVLSNDNNSFKLLVEKYQDKIFRTCYAFFKNREDAEDITQEVFIKVYNKLSDFRGDSEFSTWLYRITVNMCINLIRKNKWKKLMLHFENDENRYILNSVKNIPDTNFIDNIEETQKKQLLSSSINSLPFKQRTAFILHKYEDLPQNEIAEIMKTSVSAVESLIHRAKINLQKKLINLYNEFY